MTKGEKNIIQLIKARIREKSPDAEVILFGSRARGDARKDSDWDILILLDQLYVSRLLEKEYRDELFDIELETGELLSVFVFSKTDWEKKHFVTPFYQNIKKEGICL